MKTSSLNIVIITVSMFILAMFTVWYMSSTKMAIGSAPSGLPSTLATSTLLALASRTATTLIATSSCASRVVSTTNSSLMLTFSNYNGASPSEVFGHMQIASTTVVYDSGQYGCGLVKAFADTATNITVTETR